MAHLVLRNVTMIDGTGADPRPGTTIVVRDTKIEAIVPDDRAAYPEDAAVYNGAGRYALPGLIDSHIHIAFTGSPDRYEMINQLPSFYAIRSTVHARKLLHAGITTIRDASSNALINIALRQAVDGGLVEGPRIRACGFGLKMTGGHGDSFYGPHVEIESPGLCNSPDECRKVARMNLKHGADHIKIISASGGVLSAGTLVGVPQFSVEEMRAAVDEAHRAGKKAMAHCHGPEAIKNALEAGMDSIEHGTLMDDEGLEMMLKQGAFLVPTLLALHRIIQHGEGGGIPEYAVRKAKEVRDRAYANFRRAVEAGVKIAMGTDAGTPYNFNGENLNELPLMVQNGMTPMQALVATTRMGAELLDLSSKLGTLEVGKLADVVVVDGNPLADIDLFTDPKRVAAVVKDGKVVRS